MRSVTDGVNTMKTIHNSTHIEDTFAVRREKVANIIGTTATTLSIVQQYYLNPGNSVLFPIFSQIAATYEQYRVNTLVFSYETEAYTASGSNVSAGKVILVTNYDPSDAAFTTDQQMEDYSNSDRGAPYCEIVHDVLGGDHSLKGEPLKNYFVNSSANAQAPSNDSSQGKFYTIGNFQLGCQGNASSTAEIGELYVTYSFTMIRPKQQTPLGQNLLVAHIVESAPGTAAASGSAFLGTTGGVLRAGSTLNSVCTKNTFTLPTLGRFLIAAQWVGSVAAVATWTPGSNITAVSLTNDSQSNMVGTVSSGNTSVVGTYDVTAAGTGAANTMTIASLTSLAAGTADIFISQIPSGLTVLRESRIERLERMLKHLSSQLRLQVDDDDCESPYHEVKEAEPPRKSVVLPPIPKRGWLSPSLSQ